VINSLLRVKRRPIERLFFIFLYSSQYLGFLGLSVIFR
jgi:hypothetical protein